MPAVTSRIVEQAPLTEIVELTRCRRCASAVLRGHADGILTTVDLVPLDHATELAALLARRATYDVIRWGGLQRAILCYRTADRMTAERRHPVAVEHRCPPGATWRKRSEPDPVLAAGLLVGSVLATPGDRPPY